MVIGLPHRGQGGIGSLFFVDFRIHPFLVHFLFVQRHRIIADQSDELQDDDPESDEDEPLS